MTERDQPDQASLGKLPPAAGVPDRQATSSPHPGPPAAPDGPGHQADAEAYRDGTTPWSVPSRADPPSPGTGPLPSDAYRFPQPNQVGSDPTAGAPAAWSAPVPQAPQAPRVRRDRLAVALGNGSLLGIGYLMLRRRGFAVLSWLVTVVLLAVLVSSGAGWVEIAVLVWWAAVIAHGWWLAGRPVPLRRQLLGPLLAQRLVTGGIALAVLVAFGLLRFDAVRIDHAVADARADGDCAEAAKALDRISLGDRMADAPLAAHDDTTGQVCKRLHTAGGELATAVAAGDVTKLKSGFDDLTWVLTERPGHEKMVGSALDSFVSRLPAKDPCHTAAVTDWLRARKPHHDSLDRAADVVPRTAPAALIGCGDELMAAKDWRKARTRYQQLLDRYPDSTQTAKARKGARKATLSIELDDVRDLLDTSTNAQPTYCSDPAKYEGAPAYHKGTNKSLVYGRDKYADKLPKSWRSHDPAHAVLVVCIGNTKQGSAVRTCPYEYLGSRRDVTFHKEAVGVKVYELRTGKLVRKRTVQISGSSCPQRLPYSYDYVDTGPPSDVYVTPSKATVRAAFRPMVSR